MAKFFTLRKVLTAVVSVAACFVLTASFIGCDSLSGGESSSGSTNSDYNSNSGSGSSANGGSDSANGSDDTSTADTSYSSIFTTILTSSSYLTRNEKVDFEHDVSEGYSYSCLSQKYSEIPYGLEDADFNAQKTYNDELECVSVPYFINGDNNTLYLSVRAEHVDDSTMPYYTCYILKYTITDKEYSELTQIYSGSNFLMPFYIQELSKQKTATIVNKVKLTVYAYEQMLKYLKNHSDLSTDVFGSTSIDFDFIYFTPQETDHDEQYMILNVRSDSTPTKKTVSTYSFINEGEIRTLTLHPSTLSDVKTLNDEGVVYKFPYETFKYTADDYQNDENATQITYYHTFNTINSYDASYYLSD